MATKSLPDKLRIKSGTAILIMNSPSGSQGFINQLKESSTLLNASDKNTQSIINKL